RLLPRILAFIAGWNSRELFILTITAIGLGIGYATYLFGLSFAFGAFVAGMVLSESDYGHQALSDIIPLRDIFGLLFFTSVGMLLDINFLLAHWDKVLLMVLLVAVGKGVIFAGLTRLFGYGNVVPIAVAFGLFQVGEFSFVLARVGLETKAIGNDMYSFVLATAVISMVATPFVSGFTTPLYKLKKRFFRHEALQTANMPEQELRQHVVIAGGGRVGRHIAHILRQIDVPFVIIELNHQRKEECKEAGLPVIFGDVSQPVVLEAAEVSRAKLLLITIPSIVTTQSIVKLVHRQQPGLHVVARAEGQEQMKTLYKTGVYMVVLPELEAGLEIARQALIHLQVPVTMIQGYTDMVRQQLYAPIYNSHYDYRLITQLNKARDLLEISWVTIPADSSLHGRTIKDTAIRTRTGASLVAVIHGGIFSPNPTIDYCFSQGDLVAVIGNAEQRESFKLLAGG
ncbi:MAG: cation:proton antiporter, partial [Deltaproteobacteria bacterium]|nr:cation:proton antiporter [Deltaproteobacteria bacterium]